MAFNLNQLKMLKNESVKNKIDFICSVFDKESLDNVLKLNPKFIKIASSDITDLYLLKLIKKSKKSYFINWPIKRN